MKQHLIWLAVCLLAAAPTLAITPDGGEEWTTLFDGGSLDAWRGYQQEEAPGGWSIEGETLKFAGSGGNLITRQAFGDFDLRFEWKVTEGANSGVLYLVSEDQPQPYLTGPEYQVLDNQSHRDGGSGLTSAGALYGLYPATVDPKPVGEWNTGRIVLQEGRVRHFLNGELVADAVIGGEDWSERVASSKFANWGRFAKNQRGHLVLQDHGDVVYYRGIKLRPLD